MDHGVDAMNVLEFLFPKPKDGQDLYSTYGTGLGGSVDLSWTISRWLDLFAFNHLWDDRKENFRIEEWARRKESQAAAQFRTGLVGMLDYLLYRFWYPKKGADLYRSYKAHLLYEGVKTVANFYLIRLTWKRLSEGPKQK